LLVHRILRQDAFNLKEYEMSEHIAQIEHIISSGESRTIEFKQALREPLVLARLIAAFANAEGGRIIVGVREPSAIIGVDRKQLTQIYEQAIRLIQPTPKTTLEFVPLQGKEIGIVSVAKSDTLVISQNGAFIRDGSEVRAMSAPEIAQKIRDIVSMGAEGDKARVPNALSTTATGSGTLALPGLQVRGTGTASPPLDIAAALSTLTKMVENLETQLRYTNSFRAKVENYVVGGVVGAILGWLFSAVIGRLLGI
jgi:hypothetical protein